KAFQKRETELARAAITVVGHDDVRARRQDRQQNRCHRRHAGSVEYRVVAAIQRRQLALDRCDRRVTVAAVLFAFLAIAPRLGLHEVHEVLRVAEGIGGCLDNRRVQRMERLVPLDAAVNGACAASLSSHGCSFLMERVLYLRVDLVQRHRAISSNAKENTRMIAKSSHPGVGYKKRLRPEVSFEFAIWRTYRHNQRSHLPDKLPELAPSLRTGGCRGFIGPFPQPLWIRVSRSRLVICV